MTGGALPPSRLLRRTAHATVGPKGDAFDAPVTQKLPKIVPSTMMTISEITGTAIATTAMSL